MILEILDLWFPPFLNCDFHYSGIVIPHNPELWFSLLLNDDFHNSEKCLFFPCFLLLVANLHILYIFSVLIANLHIPYVFSLLIANLQFFYALHAQLADLHSYLSAFDLEPL